jgi:hypothetical protein
VSRKKDERERRNRVAHQVGSIQTSRNRSASFRLPSR